MRFGKIEWKRKRLFLQLIVIFFRINHFVSLNGCLSLQPSAVLEIPDKSAAVARGASFGEYYAFPVGVYFIVFGVAY
jgi:hypothetical protein